MARARNIKPGFFSNELLAELPPLDRLLFIGLWCLADREGRLEDRPKRIKMELFPCDNFDVDAALSALESHGFLARYKVGDVAVIEIANFAKHQNPHGSERDSSLPDRDGYLTINERKRNVIIQGEQRKIHVSERDFNVKATLDNAGSIVSERPDSPILRFSDSPIQEKTCSTHSVERVDFDAFWKIYPRKVGKQAALKAWNKLKPDLILFTEIESAIERAKRSPAWLKDSGQFIPHPSAWLNGKRWEDEPDPASLMPCQEIADAYNEICGGVFRRCESMTPERMTLIASVGSREIAGRKRFIEGGVDYWRKFFTAAAKSKAWAGNNPRGFVADFDYVLKNANNVFESFQ